MRAQIFAISDALFLAGLLVLIVAAMGLVLNSGLFDIVSFSTKRFLDVVLTRPRQVPGGKDGFAQYLARPRRRYDVRLLAICGAVCMLLSAIAAFISRSV
ncbi:MAG: DUF3899 domain-containing protein [Bacillota bacterium]